MSDRARGDKGDWWAAMCRRKQRHRKGDDEGEIRGCEVEEETWGVLMKEGEVSGW